MNETLQVYVLFKVARLPIRADASALGSLPTRAFRYCEAIRTASAFGWYIFPAINFSLLWESESNGLCWRCDDIEGLDRWTPLSGAIQFPGCSISFDAVAPENIRGFSPPWLTRMWEPGHVQIWSGLIARTRSGIGLLIRPVANLPRSGGYEVFEGIVESDNWFGPLFSNIRLTRSDCPVEFRTDWPIAQLQPIPRSAYTDPKFNEMTIISGPDKFTDKDWNDFRHTVVVPNLCPNRPFGGNAIDRRRRIRKMPVQDITK